MSASTRAAALPRELAEFLIELSIALSKHAMYPADHPSLKPAAEAVIRRLDRLLAGRSSVALGVARSQLVIEGMATDPKNPVLKELAGRLHRHHLGAMTFKPGTTLEELSDLLHVLSRDPERGAEPLGLGPASRLRAWKHISLYPLSYERLQLVEGAGEESGEEAERRTRPAQLWLGLAQAAMASERDSSPGDEDSAPKPSRVAEAIKQHSRDKAYDQVIVGYLLQIAEEIKRGGGKEAALLRERVSELLRRVDRETLARLLQMGGDRRQRLQFVLDASEALAVEAVIELIAAAAAAEEETVSHSMLRMLRKLGEQATAGTERRRALAERSIREQVAELVRDWSLRDPNPEGYRVAMERIVAQPRFDGSQGPGVAVHPPEPMRILLMALELDIPAQTVKRAVEELVKNGELAAVTRILDQSGSEDAVRAIWEQIASEEVVRAVVTREPIDVEQLDLLLERVGIAAAEPMLDALAASESMQTRRVLLDRLVKLGPAVGPLAVKRLKDASWYVQRNMLAILCELEERPPDFDARPLLDHPDARVRREALRYLLGDPSTRERAIHYALADPDERATRMGLAVAIECGLPDSAVPLAASLAAGGSSPEQRLAAVKALATNRSPAAADALLALVQPRKRGLFRRKVPGTAEARAALEALESYTEHERVRKALAELRGG
ncbi:MAG: hypothetical protein KatS3mg081_0369 [Gemmatimonadales bacterium]|nr:MAG: hypothetical protein KatS3mg081_0369 [Gemmatimonadales bacterium]